MTRQDAYELGFDRGQGCGSCVDIFDNYEAYAEQAHEAEDNARQYSDFSFIAHDINSARYPDELRDRYDEGVVDGIAEQWARRPADMRQDDIT